MNNLETRRRRDPLHLRLVDPLAVSTSSLNDDDAWRAAIKADEAQAADFNRQAAAYRARAGWRRFWAMLACAGWTAAALVGLAALAVGALS
jgi:hypothetical protein